jgi:RNA polymerase sigma-70 factor (ECF subfamily)
MEGVEKLSVNIPAENPSKSGDEPIRVEPSDREVVAHCQRGELQAYELLVNRYRQKVYHLAYGMLRNEQDATDIAQEAFVRAWRGIKRFKSNASFYTWIYRITTNLCIDFVRKRDRRPTTPFEETIDPDTDANVAEPPSSHPSPRDEAQRTELREQIDAALAELSPDHRAVIHLREFEGLDYAEIARVMNCSIGTVMSRLHYARKHLQKLLRDEI